MSLKSAICLFTSRTKWMGWTSPLWFIYYPKKYKITGKQYNKIFYTMIPGDIIITRADGFLSNIFIPGYWCHAGICTDLGYVTHATNKGVHEDTLYDFLEADNVVILRSYPYDASSLASDRAKHQIGKDYDFDFDFNNSNRFACTELITYCYKELITERRRSFGRQVVVADDIINNNNFYKVLEVRK